MMPVTIPGTEVETERRTSTRRGRRRRNDPYGTPYEREGEFDRRFTRGKRSYKADFLGAPIAGKLEYLRDNENVDCEDDDPFHILLMSETFANPRINVEYVAVTLAYVLGMPSDEAKEHSKFACEQGMSCLGTWTHKECLDLGGQLQARDIICRVVPYSEGSSSGWQAKEAEDGGAMPNLSPLS